MNIEELDYQEKATKAVNHVVLFQPQVLAIFPVFCGICG